MRSTRFGTNGAILCGGVNFERSLRFYDVVSGREETFIDNSHPRSIYSIAKMSPGSIATGSMDGSVKAWDINELKTEIFVQRAHQGCVSAICPHPNPSKRNTHVFTGGWDASIRLYDLTPNRGHALFEMKEHKDAIQDLFSFGTDFFASCASDGIVSVWDLKETEEIQHYDDHQGVVYCLGYNEIRETLYSGGSDNTVRLFNPKNSDGCFQTLPMDDIIVSLKVLSDRNLVIAGDSGGCVYYIDERNTKHYLKKFRAHDNWISSITSIEMSDTFFTSSWDGLVKVFDTTKAGKAIQQFSNIHPVYAICHIESHYLPSKKNVRGVRMPSARRNVQSGGARGSVPITKPKGKTRIAVDEDEIVAATSMNPGDLSDKTSGSGTGTKRSFAIEDEEPKGKFELPSSTTFKPDFSSGLGGGGKSLKPSFGSGGRFSEPPKPTPQFSSKPVPRKRKPAPKPGPKPGPKRVTPNPKPAIPSSKPAPKPKPKPKPRSKPAPKGGRKKVIMM